MTTSEKKDSYGVAMKEIRSLIAPDDYWISKMATINCILKQHLPYYFWVGFYVLHKEELVIGPYQGTLGCLRIAMGRGVCGTTAVMKKTQIVADVHQFPGYIACDSASKSEIVVPVFNNKRELMAVFDVDSIDYGSFDEVDQQYLETIMHEHFVDIDKPKLHKPIARGSH